MSTNNGRRQFIKAAGAAGLLSAVEDYYEALTAYRAGDLDPIVAAFSSAAFHAVGNGERLVRDLLEIRARWRTSLRARSDACAPWPLLATPALRDGDRTLYARFGDAPLVAILAAIALASSLLARRRERVDPAA